MHTHSLEAWKQPHNFLRDTSRKERRVLGVVGLTACMMVAEIVSGTLFGSMALLADGWHMATHVSALLVSYFTYLFARKKADSPFFSFGTGKVGALGGFASAIGLGLVALLMGFESIERLLNPVAVSFKEALFVAGLGLGVNLASAYVLDANETDKASDPNLASAYFHVLADALTSVTAIIALLAGLFFGWVWMDAAMGLAGAFVISHWSYGLLAQTGAILLDFTQIDTAARIRAVLEEGDITITDLHVWSVSPNHLAAIVAIVTHEPKPPEYYKERLSHIPGLAHVSIEVNACPGDTCKRA